MAGINDAPLPDEIVQRGAPLQAHPAKVMPTSWIMLGAGIFFLAASGLFVFMYYNVTFKKDDPVPPETMLYIAAGVALLGVIFLVAAALKGDFSLSSQEAYLIYADALVMLKKDSFVLIRWDEVESLLSPKSGGDYRVVARDGRVLPIRRAFQDYSNLIAAVYSRISNAIVPPLVSAIQAGQEVSMGPFLLSQRCVGYKGKTLDWDRVAVLRIEVGALGRRLRIRAAGSLLPWCYCDLDSFPNGVFFGDVLSAASPSRLLVPTRPF